MVQLISIVLLIQYNLRVSRDIRVTQDLIDYIDLCNLAVLSKFCF